MRADQPSRTALGAAALRAAHQVLDGGCILSDPLAQRILGDLALPLEADDDPGRRGLRLFIAARTRFAEDAIAVGVGNGLRQLVILGAGLDTYAYRTPFAERLRIFEVDHPATQAWKRQRLADAAIEVPAALTFAPIDFEHGTLAQGLAGAGFDPAQRSFFSWLGVVPYLTKPAVVSTLAFIGALQGGAQVVFDYATPPGEGSRAHEALASRVASVGEPFQLSFSPEELATEVRGLGFVRFEDLSAGELVARYLPNVGGAWRGSRGHVFSAATT